RETIGVAETSYCNFSAGILQTDFVNWYVAVLVSF
ncbi:hypothetical protein D918_02239, partial [Trichuris suis]